MIEGIIPGFLFNYTQIILLLKSHLKSHYFRKCSHLIFLHVIGFNNISLRTHNLPSKNLGVATPSSIRIDAYVKRCFL